MDEFLIKLQSCGYDAKFAKTKEEALSLAKDFIKDGMKIGLGGSVSVQEIGLFDYLINKKNVTLYNQYEDGISMQENIKRRRQGLLSDIFISSSNAITKDGKLINADGSGNRVAALSYGPEKVLLVIGKNKIVDTLEDGFKRVMNVAAKKNIDRVNSKSISFGKAPKYNLDNIANKFSWIKADEDKNRIIIILVDEDLGY